MIALLCSVASLFAVLAYVAFLAAWQTWRKNTVLLARLDETENALARRDKQCKQALAIIDHFRADVLGAAGRAVRAQTTLDKGKGVE